MSAWSDTFTEVKRAVQPDDDPKLTYGGGSTADATKELDAIILASARGKVWSAGLVVVYGDIIFPSVRMGRRFMVTKSGTLGSTEQTWPDYENASVTDNGVTLVEVGGDYSSIYDVGRAIHDALDLKVKKSMNDNQYLQDSRGQASSYLYLNLVRERDKYATVGVG